MSHHKGILMQRVQIRVKGRIDGDWNDWFGGLTIHHLETGETVISGPLQDHSAIYGLIARMSTLDLQLCSIRIQPIDTGHKPRDLD